MKVRRPELSLLRIPADLEEARLKEKLKNRVFELVRQCLQDGSLEQVESPDELDKRKRPLAVTDHGREMYRCWTGRRLPPPVPAKPKGKKFLVGAEAQAPVFRGRAAAAASLPPLIAASSAASGYPAFGGSAAGKSFVIKNYEDLGKVVGELVDILTSSNLVVTVSPEKADVFKFFSETPLVRPDESYKSALRQLLLNPQRNKLRNKPVQINALNYLKTTSVEALRKQRRMLQELAKNHPLAGPD